MFQDILLNLPSTRVRGVYLSILNDTRLKTKKGDLIDNNLTADPTIRKTLNIRIDRQKIVYEVFTMAMEKLNKIV